jgi:membrane-associated phospholipid phosphatase
MTLLIHYLQLTVIMAVCMTLGLFTIVGTDRISIVYGEYRSRLFDALPHLGLLGIVFVLSRFWRPLGGELAWTVGLNITHTLYTIEGHLVAYVQGFATTELTWVLSIVYVFGYVFLLVFPLVAYLFLDDLRPLRVTTLAYAINYLVGLVCYTVFIAYGPRNYMPGEVEGLMYDVWPEIETLTTHINANTNVFPSLHVSLSITIALLAWLTRDSYPRWLYVSAPLALAVAFSTMYLGLHWGVDVVAGVLLAVGSVAVASRIAAEETEHSVITRTGRQMLTTALRSFRRVEE